MITRFALLLLLCGILPCGSVAAREPAEFDEARFAALLDGIRGGEFSAETAAELTDAFATLAGEQAMLAAFGRKLMEDATGAAVESGRVDVLQGMRGVLEAIMDDLAHPYSMLAQELLSEMVRCAAASLGERALFEEITARVNPDRDLASTPRAPIRLRYPLSQRADLYHVAARGGRVVAVGGFGTLLVSDDRGESWAAPSVETDEPFFAVAFGPRDEVWAVGRAGAVAYSSDAGRSFELRSSPFDRHLFGVYAPAPGAALAVGDYGLQLSTTTAGETWECVPRGEDVILGRIVPAGADAFLVGEFGTLERRSAAGAVRAGRIEGVPADTYLFDVWFDEGGSTGLAVGLAGTVLRSVDAGVTWRPARFPFDADLYAVGGAGSLVVVAGQGAFIGVSRDRGESFHAVEVPVPPLPFTGVAFADERQGYVVGPRGLVLATSDGALTFRVVHPGADE